MSVSQDFVYGPCDLWKPVPAESFGALTQKYSLNTIDTQHRNLFLFLCSSFIKTRTRFTKSHTPLVPISLVCYKTGAW